MLAYFIDDSLTSDIEQESPTVVQPKPSSPVPPAATSAPAAPKPNMCVIDLTIDSSDDEDPPTTSTAQTVESVRPQNTLGLDNLVIKKQVSLPTEENSTPQHQSNSTTADSIFNQVPSNNSTNMRFDFGFNDPTNFDFDGLDVDDEYDDEVMYDDGILDELRDFNTSQSCILID